MSKRKPTRRQRAASSCAGAVSAGSTIPPRRPDGSSNTSRVEVFRDGVDTGYLGNHQNWWFDPSFEHSFSIFDLDGFYEGTYFENDHVGPEVVTNYVDHVLFYGREFLGRDVESVLELGCGGGWFTEEFLRRGLDVQAVEGSREGYERALKRGVPPERLTRHDLRQPLDMGRTFDIAVCTEVAEHIECPFSSQLIANVTRHAKLAWFSFEEPATNAAHYHHCNEQPARFWEQLFRYYGFEPLWLPADVMVSVELRGNAVFHARDLLVTDRLRRASSPAPVKVAVPNTQADTVKALADQLRSRGLPVKLHLGCGYQVLDGYINIDLYTPAADVQLDITDLSCLEDESVDEIYLNAVFEHLYGYEHRKALAEWRRVLKPGGKLAMDSLPDFDEVVRAYINQAPGNSGGTFDIEEVSRYTHGAPTEHNKLGQMHKDVFNRERIARLLEGAGFEVSQIESVRWKGEPNPVNLNISAVKAESARHYALERTRPEPPAQSERFAPLAEQQREPSFAAVYCVYDDAAWLAESVESIYNNVAAIYVLVSDRPWNGDAGDCSETLKLVESLPDPAGKIQLVRGSWATEAEQRNAGLDLVSEAGHGYCMVIDADEVYHPTDLRRMMKLAVNHAQIDCWHASMDTYWKSWRHRIDPREPLKPAVFLKTGSARFTENRNVSECVHGLIGPEVGFCHHLSYARSDEQLLRKIATFSHADEVRSGWYESVWRRWDSDHSMTDLHPTHPAAYKRAVEQPYWALPPVLRKKWEGEAPGGAPLTSIIILAHNQLDYTRKCIESIQRHTPEPHEVVVVDNGSTDGTREYLRDLSRQDPTVRLITSDTNLGFAGGNNLGIQAASGDYVLLMNNDVVVTPHWLERMLSCAARAPEIGIIGPMSNSVSGAQIVEQSLYETESLGGLEQFAAEWTEKHSREVLPTWRVVGFCMLIRRAVIEKIGGLDTRFGIGNFEDDDFCIRATLAGFKSVIARDSFVHHFGSRTFRGEKVDYNGLLARNWEVYKQKWGLPRDLRYGVPYDLSPILKQSFDRSRHHCPLSGGSRMESAEPRGKRPRLSLCMIARDEEKFIADCIESVRDIVDEVVVVDTGSRDNTPDIVRSCGGSVHQFEWIEDYSAARNEALSHAAGDWVLVLDADERLDPSSKEAVLSAISSGKADAYELTFHNYCRAGSTTPDIVHKVCRLFRNRPEYRFEGRVHENVVPSIVAAGGVIRELEAVVHHYGYTPDVKKTRNKHERYLSLLMRELEEKPDDIYVLHHVSAAHCAEEQFEQALPYLERLTDIIPPDHTFAGQAFSRLMNACWATGRYQQALDAAERAERKRITHPEITFSKGNALLALGRHAEAAAAFEQAIQIGASGEWLGDPGTYGYKARFGIARALAGLGDLARTLELCRQVVQEQPNHAHAHEVLALSAEQLGRAEEAERHWNEVLRIVPEHADAPAHLAELAEQAGRLDEAEAHYRHTLQARPDSVAAANDLGRVCAAQGKLEESLEAFARAVEIDPSYANAYFNAGDVLYSAGSYQQAADIYQNGLSLEPTRAAGFLTLGNCCFQLGAFEAAITAYTQALELDPELHEAENNLQLAQEAVREAA